VIKDQWFNSLLKQIQKERKQKGFYSNISHLRWIIAIEQIINGLSAESKILKTDAWNEAVGRGLVNNFKYDFNINLCDISPYIIEQVRNEFPDSYVMDVKNLNFPDKYFDLILDISTSDHCPEINLPSIIKGYSRILDKRGKLLLIHNSNKAFLWRLLKIFGKTSPSYSGFPPAYYFDPNYVKSLLEKDFYIEKISCTNVLGWAKPILNKLPKINNQFTRFIASIEIHIDHRILSYFGRQYLFFCKKNNEN
jgi:hypothetical protein